MKSFIIVCLMLLCHGPTMAGAVNMYEAQLEGERNTPVPSCNQLVEQKELCLEVRMAESLIRAMDLQIFEREERSGSPKKPVIKKTLRREVGLVAKNPADGSRHQIIFDMPIVGDATFQPHVQTAGYEVKRIKGTSYIKMGYEVKMVGMYEDDREVELLVIASGHLSIPDGIPTSNLKLLRERAERKVYLAVPPHLAPKEVSDAGQRFALNGIEAALEILRTRGVESKAYPGELVGSKIPAKAVLALIAAEQIDPCLLEEPYPGCKSSILKNPFVSDEQVAQATLAQFFWNGYGAFSDICSSANACGVLQFTNQPKRRKDGTLYAGTYNDIRISYPSANLDPIFRRGSQSFVNSAMAAALLIDKELSYKSIPQWVREAFVRDFRVGLPFLGSSYNAGAPEGKKCVALFTRYQTENHITEVKFETFPWHRWLDWAKKSKSPLPTQTHRYVGKIIMFFQQHDLSQPM